jgi:uncharacterized FAD-dependent dehydrogenase
VNRFVDRLAREPGIERAVHEDREIVLVQARHVGIDQLRAIVERLWTAARSAA